MRLLAGTSGLPIVGAALIALADAPLALLNIVAGVVYALAMPFVALTTTYVYFDARVSEELEPATPALLPPEVELSAGCKFTELRSDGWPAARSRA
jgi:hypothetical protein